MDTAPLSTLTRRLDSADDRIRRGDLVEARRLFALAVQRGVPRQEAARAGALAARLGFFEKGIRLLHPLVRPPARRTVKATLAEIAEYAHLLVKHGAIDEGGKLLHGLDEKGYPRVLLYRVSAQVARWEYGDSIPLLLRYLCLPGIPPYDRLVAEVNLAAAYVHEGQPRKSTPLLRELLHTCSLRGFEFALGKVLELSAQNFISQRKWSEAEKFLLEATNRLKRAPTAELLYVKTFRAIVEFLKHDGAKGTRKPLLEVRADAERRGSWETTRNCDRALATVDKDTELLARLWFGTPFPRYRSKILSDFGAARAPLPPMYDWIPGPSSGDPLGVLDLMTGTVEGKKAGFSPGSLPQRLLIALAEDFYRPLRLGELFGRLYPDRTFDPDRAPHLVHGACYRVRRIFESRRIPLSIDETDGFYRLVTSAPFAIRIRRTDSLGSRERLHYASLRERFDGPFTIVQAMRALDVSQRTALRILRKAVEGGEIHTSGRGRATRYVLAPTKK